MRPRSSPRPSTAARPRTNPPETRRSTSVSLPLTTTRAPTVSRSASIGSSAAASALPIWIASVTVPRTVAPLRAWAAVIVYSVEDARPPNSTESARAIRSIHAPFTAVMVRWLPRSSVSTDGDTLTPAISIVTCGTSGNARPIPSASTTGRPRWAAQLIGCMPFAPPISAAISAATRPPRTRSSPSRSQRPSSPCSELLDRDDGRPDVAAGHDQRVVGQFVEVDQAHRPEPLDGMPRGEQAGVCVAAAARAEHGAAERHGREVFDLDLVGPVAHPSSSACGWCARTCSSET